MKSPRTLIFIGFQLLCITISLCLLGVYLGQLRRFESDADEFESKQAEEETIEQSNFGSVTRLVVN